jgi:hypothetical protein
MPINHLARVFVSNEGKGKQIINIFDHQISSFYRSLYPLSYNWAKAMPLYSTEHTSSRICAEYFSNLESH